MSIMAVISVGLLVLAGYVWYTFRNIDSGVTRLNVAVGGKASQSPASSPNGQDQNILLVGNDDRSNLTKDEIRKLHVGISGGSKSTDTMMIVHVPADGSKASLISLPRDSYVHIKDNGMNRLNAAYVFGYNAATNATENQRRSAGANLLISTITDLTGLTIDHYIQVSLLGFYEISDAIGGVPVTLCHAVDDSHAANQAAGLSGGSGFKMSKGRHVIKGVQALEFVRQRHFLPHGDLDRVRRQQYFLTAAFRQVASVGILVKLRALGDAIKRNIVLDPGLHLLDLATQMEKLSANNINGKTIPTTPETIDGNDVLAVSPAKVRRFVDKIINPAEQTASPSGSTTKSAPTTSPAPSTSTKPIDAKCIN